MNIWFSGSMLCSVERGADASEANVGPWGFSLEAPLVLVTFSKFDLLVSELGEFNFRGSFYIRPLDMPLKVTGSNVGCFVEIGCEIQFFG